MEIQDVAPAAPVAGFDPLAPAVEIQDVAPAAPVAGFDPFAPNPEAPADESGGLFGALSNLPEENAAPESDTSDLYGLDASFADAANPAESGDAMNDLAFLNNDLDAQAPALDNLEVPAQAPTPAQASPPVGDPFGSLSDLVVDDEAEEERGGVLKFLRRD